MKTSWAVACGLLVLVSEAVRADDAYPQSIPTQNGSEADYKKLEASARDGEKLCVHEWAAAETPAGNPVVLFIPGIGMHGKPYGSIAPGFTSQKITFVVPDLRGHGESGGAHGRLAAPHVLRADLGAVIALINKRHPDAPVILSGESMGGLIAADYAWRGERPLAALALLAPAFKVHPSLIYKVPDPSEVLLGVNLDSDDRLKSSTRVDGFIKARMADKQVLHKVELSYLLTIAGMQAEWPRAAAELKLPLFVCIAGKDKVTDPAAAKESYNRAATPEGKKKLVELDDAYHTLCWDDDTPSIIKELAEWALEQRPKGVGAKDSSVPEVRDR
jgi:alpha-beta hydrolase superfamily lysophospholipase